MRNEPSIERRLITALPGALFSALFSICLAFCLMTGCSATTNESERIASSSALSLEQDALSNTSDLAEVPAYSGQDTLELNGGIPSFTEDDIAVEDGTEVYGELDSLGRATSAFAKLCENTRPAPGSTREGKMPDPSGFVQAHYPDAGIDHLYERSHLIAYSLSDEAVNPLDLITGTEHLNQDTMGKIEGKIRGYLNGGADDSRHVLMRVTPDFRGEELVARGVQIEALSLEDEGRAICLNVYCYNIQPGVAIDYATGASWLTKTTEEIEATPQQTQGIEQTYVLNTNTKRFHYESCDSAAEMKPKNRKETTATREELIAQGYRPCGICKP